MTTKIELQELLVEAELNVSVLESELNQYYDLIAKARKERAVLRLIDQKSLGVSGVVSIRERLELFKDIFGEGESDVLREV